MRCKNIVLSLLIILLCAAIPSVAADYNILVKNGMTRNNGANLYVRLRNSNPNQTSACTALSSYGDGSFYVQATMDEARTPTLSFYTRAGCNGTAVATVTPFAGAEPVASDIIITITDRGATQANSPDPITPPQTANPGGDRPGRPGGPGTTTQVKRKVIRFFAPWANTSAIVYVAGGENAKMTTVKNYCGWFEARITPPEGSLQVYFKQTIGYDYVGDFHYTKIDPAVQSILLSLDSAAAQTDTIWVKAGKEIGAPTVVYNKYPGILGDCPVKTLPVMMFDWFHGELGDGDIVTTFNRRDSTTTTSYGNGAKDLYYSNPIYATSNDFGSGGCGGSNATDSQRRGYMRGMVEQYLGPNGVPVQAANFPEECKLTTHINQWFLPQVLAQKNGRDYTNATCRSIELSLDTGGLWLGQKNASSPEGGLFLLDDFQYLDDEKTIENPFFDNISANRKRHNFGRGAPRRCP